MQLYLVSIFSQGLHNLLLRQKRFIVKEVAYMATVYVLNKDGKPLMPTTRCGHIRHLLKEKKARVVRTNPFTIKLVYETDDVVQPLYLGIDPGRTNIGVAVVKVDGTAVFTAHLETRNKEIPKLMAKRKEHRQGRRHYRRCKRQRRAAAHGTLSKKCKKQDTAQGGNISKRAQTIGVFERNLPGCEKSVLCIGIKNKEARFNNRVRPARWLTPTANQLLLTHVNFVKKICKFLPISDVVLEINKFAFMALDNPNIQKWQYQQGPLYQKGSLENAVSEQQDHHCLFCEKTIEHYHHVILRSENGSDTIANIVGLCAEHHDLIHKDDKLKEELAKKKQGLNKKYGALSVLNQIIPALTYELGSRFQGHFYVTTGKSTYDYRAAHSVSKDHWLDAYCIACSVLPDGCFDNTINSRVPYELKQFRRHDRQVCQQQNVKRKYYLDKKLVATNRHKAIKQETDSLEEYRNNGGTTDKLVVKEHKPTNKRLNRILPGALMAANGKLNVMVASRGLHNGIPDNYVFDNNSKAKPSKCTLINKNKGIVFVSNSVS